MKKRILVAGGAGFIGSHVNKILNLSGYETLVLDNLSKGNAKTVTYGTFIQGDIGDAPLLDSIFEKYPFDAVMHFAAYIDVGESVLCPTKYYENNFSKTLVLLNTLLKHGVKTFIFSSSAAVYGNPQEVPLSESHPTSPINPYGHTKLMIETVLQDLNRSHQMKFAALRYFNAAGGDPEGEIKNYNHKESNLIPIVLRSLKNGKPVTIHGTDYPTRDGTCVRDYIHVNDLATAHILAMESLFLGNNAATYNLGNGQGFSIKEVFYAIENVTGLKISSIEGPRRAGDPPILVANAAKALGELGWKPKESLETMIAHAWKALF
jgi:UDP-glucose 4-epimerase